MCKLQVKIADVQLRGMPESLLAGEPYSAPTSVVMAESVSSLLRILYTSDEMWNLAVSSAVTDRLQHVDSLTAVLSRRQCQRNNVSCESGKLITVRGDVIDDDICDKTIADEVIETIDGKDALAGIFLVKVIS